MTKLELKFICHKCQNTYLEKQVIKVKRIKVNNKWIEVEKMGQSDVLDFLKNFEGMKFTVKQICTGIRSQGKIIGYNSIGNNCRALLKHKLIFCDIKKNSRNPEKVYYYNS